MRYNMACALVTDLHEPEAALDLLEPAFGRLELDAVTWMKADPDLDAIREHPRFQAMVAAAEARLARTQSSRET
jgi:adenylate cyclase